MQAYLQRQRLHLALNVYAITLPYNIICKTPGISLNIPFIIFCCGQFQLFVLWCLTIDPSSVQVTLTPPSPSHPLPCLTLTLNPDFTLDLATTSLIGSRAKLSDVPKIHELIESKIRSILAERATWKVVLPGVKAKDVVDMLEKKSL